MWRFDSDTDPGYWVRVDSPTNVTLRDLTSTANGPVAVGDKGVAIGRGREKWGIILENGPGAKGRTLYAVDATDDGERVWFAGAGGAFGYYDIVEEERRDYSVPRGNSNGFYALAVAGERGSEKFLVGDGSGHVLPGHVENDETDWSWSTTPSGGNAVQALAHDEDGYGYAVTANGNVFMTTKDEEWEQIGVEDAQSSFYDCAYADGTFLTGGGGGMVYEADKLTDHDDEVVWTPTDLGGFAVQGLDAGRGAQLACGEGGNVFVRTAGGEWAAGAHESTHTFRAGLVDEQMVAVGANGLVVERRLEDELSPEQRALFGDTNRDDYEDGANTVGATERTTVEWETATTDDAAGSGSSGRTTTTTTRSDSPDGDTFDGRGELYDGDEQADDSGNDPADEPDEPDGGTTDSDGDSGNDAPDPADEDTDSDTDSADN